MGGHNNNKSRAAADERKQLAARVAAVVALCPQVIDVDQLRTLVGAVKLRTLPEVAKLFGAQPNTVNQTWRQGGMPGSTGAYDVAEVLAWLLERNRRQRRKQAPAVDDDIKQQLAELEIREKLAATRFKEIRTAEKEGSLIAKEVVVADLNTAVSIFREQMMGVPRRMKPMWPRDRADEWAERAEHFIRQALVQISEISVADFLTKRQQIEAEEEDAAD